MQTHRTRNLIDFLIDLIFSSQAEISKCHNCNCIADHVAAYCDSEPQKTLRCEQCECCCRDESDHAPYCERVEPIGIILQRNDPRHAITDRLNIETTGE